MTNLAMDPVTDAHNASETLFWFFRQLRRMTLFVEPTAGVLEGGDMDRNGREVDGVDVVDEVDIVDGEGPQGFRGGRMGESRECVGHLSLGESGGLMLSSQWRPDRLAGTFYAEKHANIFRFGRCLFMGKR